MIVDACKAGTARPGRHDALDCAASEFSDGKYILEWERKALSRGVRRLPGGLADRYRSCRSRTAWRKRLGRWKALTAARRKLQLVGDTSRHQSEDLSEGISGHSERDPHQVNQIGTLTETSPPSSSPSARLRHGDLAPLGRNEEDDPTSGANQKRAADKAARCRAPSASRSTTSCCASRSLGDWSATGRGLSS